MRNGNEKRMIEVRVNDDFRASLVCWGFSSWTADRWAAKARQLVICWTSCEWLDYAEASWEFV